MTENRTERAESVDGGLSRPVQRPTAVSEVTKRILGLLSAGELGPGQRLPSERQLASDLNVGRSTVREALATLDLLGLVEIRQGAGTYIKGTASDMLPQSIEWGLMLGRPRTQDLVEARTLLEVVIVQLAAERASQEDLDSLRDRFSEMKAAVGDTGSFVDADVQFHFQIAAIAKNTVLGDILQSIRSLLEVWIRRATSEEEDIQSTLDEHARIVDAVSTGNADMARGAMLYHMRQASDRLIHSLPAHTPEDETPED